MNFSVSKPKKQRITVKIGEEADNVVNDVGTQFMAAKQAKWEPPDWRQQLANIRRMHRERSAIDGAMAAGDSSSAAGRFQLLIAAMLSSQTKDGTVDAAMERLRAHGLSPAWVLATGEGMLERLIRPVSFYKSKAKFMKKTSRIVLVEYAGDIPRTYRELVGLPGIGPKMAHICMQTAWNICTGIPVDTHIHRVANRLQWTATATRTPNQTRHALEAWIPAELWRDVDELLFWFGQTECTQRRPNCAHCLNRDSCPYDNKTA